MYNEVLFAILMDNLIITLDYNELRQRIFLIIRSRSAIKVALYLEEHSLNKKFKSVASNQLD